MEGIRRDPLVALYSRARRDIRGGFSGDGTFAGVFAVNAANIPLVSSLGVGFRCAC
jgi:hypothetical protein